MGFVRGFIIGFLGASATDVGWYLGVGEGSPVGVGFIGALIAIAGTDYRMRKGNRQEGETK